MEQTLVLIKPDGVQRGLTGRILTRFEDAGLKLIALKMVHPERADVDKHYLLTEEWMRGVYDKAKAKYDAKGEAFPYANHEIYGNEIKRGLVDFLLSSPIIAIVMEAEQAVSLVRKLVGSTEPAGAPPGTIRGDFSHDNYSFANSQNRPLRNIVHASGTSDEAKHEIGIWFTEAELHAYEHVNDRVQYDASWFLPRE